MTTQEIDLNLTRPAIPEIVHVKQFDDMERKIVCRVFTNDSRYTIPAGAVVAVSGKKPDGAIFQYDSELTPSIVWIASNVVYIMVTQVMTTIGGRIFADVTITDGETVIGTFPFQLWVEKTSVESEYIVSGSYVAVIDEALKNIDEGNYTFNVGEGLKITYESSAGSVFAVNASLYTTALTSELVNAEKYEEE